VINNAGCELINTEHGKVIKITVIGDTFTLNFTGGNLSKTEKERMDFPHFLHLSLFVDRNNNSVFDYYWGRIDGDAPLSYYLYYDGNSSNVSLSLNFGYDWTGGPTYGGSEEVNIIEKMSNGWVAYNATYGESHM
jgi:hypothetical protein